MKPATSPKLRALIWLVIALGAWGTVVLELSPEARDVMHSILAAVSEVPSLLQVANTSTSVWRIIAPTLTLGLGLTVIMCVWPKPGRALRGGVIVLLVCLASGYMVFRIFATLNLDTTAEACLSLAFLAAELVIYVKSMSAYMQMFWPTDRSAQATRLSQDIVRGDYAPRVDIFVPTYSEPVEMLRRTLLGCQSMRYAQMEIYLLDDQRRPEMRALAEEVGCHYRDRPDNRDAKAGNMNAALPRSDGELIAVFDADFIPTADFLERTVGFFQDAKVGLVQTPQNFYSVDAVTRNLGLPDVLTEEQQVFFRSAQPGRDTLGAIICHGTSFLVRRKAIEQIGGFPGETLSEDWATSIKLQGMGWRTLYLNELLSAGAAAEFTSEFVTQRMRWARGTLQSLYSSTNPLTVPGLNWLQRLVHLCGPLHYLQYPCRLFCLMLPLFYFGFNMVPIKVSGELLLFYLLPYWTCQTLTQAWLTGGHRSAFWSEVYETLLCSPMTVTVLATLARPFGKPFKVSSKGQLRPGLTFNAFVGMPLLCLLLLYAAALWYAWLNAAWYPSQSILMLAFAWSVYSMVLLWLAFQASFDVPMRSTVLRFRHRFPAEVRCDGQEHEVIVVELSDADAVVEATDLDGAALLKGEAQLTLPVKGMEPINLASVELQGNRWKVSWDRPPRTQHRCLIAFLYCRPGQWADVGVPELTTFWHFLKAPFRMFPLAEGEADSL